MSASGGKTITAITFQGCSQNKPVAYRLQMLCHKMDICAYIVLFLKVVFEGKRVALKSHS